MLKRLHVQSFKSLSDVVIDFPRLTVLFGPNAAGKSNVLDAVQALSRLGTERTLADGLAEPIRGYPIEAFAFPPGGLPELLSAREARFSLEADLSEGRDIIRYRLGIMIEPGSGRLGVHDEYLSQLNSRGEPKGRAALEKVGAQIHIRRKSKPAHPRQENIGLNHSILSDPRLGGIEYRAIEKTRNELAGWRVYYLDPRVAMRSARPPEAVDDIGLLGESLAPFLYRLRAEEPKRYQSVQRTLRTLIPSITSMGVDLDPKRGTLDIHVVQDGIDYSSRILSEGTLRVLALAAIAANPWGGSLIGFEEPENGVHPQRLELIATLLWNLAHAEGERQKQVLVTTHSPVFCDALLRIHEQREGEFSLLNVRRDEGKSIVIPFDSAGPLFRDKDISSALEDANDDGVFEKLLRRGLIDA
ncbi:AAA family ATPase [Aquisphaera insulae]|uniref:AAA family ATPase n=1 Tax=Aquisphaera insulae TaxID=2712864 RepID=UPI0013EE2A9B|nr:AAA family ATPase [Aquisphaera insulae]